jgi:hypothetical protein
VTSSIRSGSGHDSSQDGRKLSTSKGRILRNSESNQMTYFAFQVSTSTHTHTLSSDSTIHKNNNVYPIQLEILNRFQNSAIFNENVTTCPRRRGATKPSARIHYTSLTRTRDPSNRYTKHNTKMENRQRPRNARLRSSDVPRNLRRRVRLDHLQRSQASHPRGEVSELQLQV